MADKVSKGRRARQKGADFEREIVRALKEKGIDAHRNLQSQGESKAHVGADVETERFNIECKLRGRLAVGATFHELPKRGKPNILIHRQPQKKTLVTCDLPTFLDLYVKSLAHE